MQVPFPRRRPRTALALALLGQLACAEPPPQRYGALVHVESDPGVALPGAEVRIDGRAIGKTDARGLLSLELSGALGEQAALEVRCPSGYRSPPAPIKIILRALSGPSRLPEYRAECRPELRTLVVSVRAQNGANVPLRHLGKELARTDAQGAAHVLLKLHPEDTVKLLLDTSAPAHKQLRPQNPELTFTMPDRDEVLLFDQPFTVEEPPKKPRPRPKAPDLPEHF